MINDLYLVNVNHENQYCETNKANSRHRAGQSHAGDENRLVSLLESGV